MEEEEFERLALVGKALSDPCRIRILLNFRGRALSISTITEELETYQSSISYHISILNKAGLIQRVDSGRWHYYTVDDQSLDIVRRFVSDCGRKGRGRRVNRQE